MAANCSYLVSHCNLLVHAWPKLPGSFSSSRHQCCTKSSAHCRIASASFVNTASLAAALTAANGNHCRRQDCRTLHKTTGELYTDFM